MLCPKCGAAEMAGKWCPACLYEPEEGVGESRGSPIDLTLPPMPARPDGAVADLGSDRYRAAALAPPRLTCNLPRLSLPGGRAEPARLPEVWCRGTSW